MTNEHQTSSTQIRLERGQRALAKINGQAGKNVIDALADMGTAAPQLKIHIEAV